MGSIKDYEIVKEESLDGLIYEVKKQLAFGWEPIGGVAILETADPNPPSKNIKYFFQAIVRYTMDIPS